MSHAHDASKWDSHATTWSSQVQSITLAPCTLLVESVRSRLPFETPNARVLDNGAGSGMMTAILKKADPSLDILATDLSGAMLETLRKTGSEQKWLDDKVETKVLNAEKLDGIEDGSISHALSTFVLSFTADPKKACQEMYRVVHPGGVIGLATWSRVSWVPVWEQAVHNTGKTEYKAPTLFEPATMEVDGLRKVLTGAGWADVEVWEFRCPHPEQTAEKATETFYNMGNPSTKLLMQGLSDEFIEKTREPFRQAWSDVWGSNRQFEVALLAVGTKR